MTETRSPDVGDLVGSQVVVRTTITWDAGRRDEAIGFMREQQHRTRELPGCLACEWTADLDDAAVFYELEWWDSEASFQNHVVNGPKYTTEARKLIRRVRAHRFDATAVTKLH